MGSFQLAEAYVEFTAKGVKSIHNAVDQTKAKVASLHGSLANLRKSLSSGMGIGNMLAGAAGIGSVTGIMAGIAKVTAEAEASQARLGAALMASGGAAGISALQISELAAGLMKVSRYDDEAAQDAMATFLSMKNIGGDIFKPALEAAANMAAFFKTDLSTAAMTVGKALDNPLRGMNTLRKAGVTLTEEQKTLIKSFMELGDVASAQKIILDALSSRMGGQFAADAATAAGGVKQLINTLGNLGEAIGGAAMAMGKGTGEQKGWIQNHIEEVTAFYEEASGVGEEKRLAIDKENFERSQAVRKKLQENDTAGAKKLMGGAMAGGTKTGNETFERLMGFNRAEYAKQLKANGGELVRAHVDTQAKFVDPALTDAQRKAKAAKDRAFRQGLRDKGASSDDLGAMGADALGGALGPMIARIKALKTEEQRKQDAEKRASDEKRKRDADQKSRNERSKEKADFWKMGPDRSKGIKELEKSDPAAYAKLQKATLDNAAMMFTHGPSNPFTATSGATGIGAAAAEFAKEPKRMQKSDIAGVHDMIAGSIDYREKDKAAKTQEALLKLEQKRDTSGLKVVIANPKDIGGGTFGA